LLIDDHYKEMVMRIFTAVLAVLLSGSACAAEGMIEVKSALSVKDTMSKFEATAKERGLIIFARIDHAAGAQKIGATLRPTELLIFGNPQGGTPLMAWEDQSGQVWLGYNDPQYLLTRHGVKECGAVAQNMRKALDGLAAAATR
jgi:uncharacterized protein (DUF302 family)